MSNKRDKGPADNPWVRKTDPADDEGGAPQEELPPSPWSLDVPPRPAQSGAPAHGGWGRAEPAQPTTPDTGTPGAGGWGKAGDAGAAAGGWGTAGSGIPGAGGGPGQAGVTGPAGTGASGWSGDAAGGATRTSSSWGDKVGPPSLRRPEPVKKKPPVPPLLLPLAGGIAVVLLVAVALVVLTGGDDKAKDPTPAPTVTTPPASTYTPPANAIAVDYGVSIVPVAGWSVFANEKQGKQLVTYAPNREPRAFLWVRQKLNVSAQTYLLAIVEGETEKDIAQLGAVRNLPCPRDVLVECVAISYTSDTKEGKVKGSVEAYRRKDGVVTALDFRSRADYAAKAESDAAPMKQSVIDSL
ncbi:hypothetical protein BWI15_23340 [Kribbella sp. ALI-6-A]|uniref:hypothetical protein n=1 Tax=Kribbella sp. ALI-6-A TaxID=1933817 RepID=UPI00097C498B|nr:hypothetical protein [Kribbella sp. ALI-6-A]ONI69511.1 hypothetical protein BWI15_23340 [Kribbella sp. ALI-6-A]